jgi:hypothetical protein
MRSVIIRRSWEVNTKTDCEEMDCYVVNWNEIAQDRFHFCAFVVVVVVLVIVMNLHDN